MPSESTRTMGVRPPESVRAASSTRSRDRAQSAKVASSSSPEPQKARLGRTKTGCRTCRWRKKKCDEAKPECNNCVKNNLECEGYQSKSIWRPAKTDNLSDGEIWSHYVQQVSRVLTLGEPCSNSLRNLVFPLAFEHDGLMHGLLALTLTHYTAVKALKTEDLSERRQYHTASASETLVEARTRHDVSDATMTLITIMCLLYKMEGNHFESDMYIQMFRDMLNRPWNHGNRQLAHFLIEVHRYHEIHAVRLSLQDDVDRWRYMINITPPHGFSNEVSQISEACLTDPRASASIGILDGLEKTIVLLGTLKHQILTADLTNWAGSAGIDINQTILELEQELQTWENIHEENSDRWHLAEIHRWACWSDLYSTSLRLDSQLAIARHTQSSQPHKSVLDNSALQRYNDSDIIDEVLPLVDNLPLSSTSQIFLLAPIFRLSCIARKARHRVRIREILRNIRSCNGSKNVDDVVKIIEAHWSRMDAKQNDATVLLMDVRETLQSLGYRVLVL